MSLGPSCILLLYFLGRIGSGNRGDGIFAWFGLLFLCSKWNSITKIDLAKADSATTSVANLGSTQTLECYMKNDTAVKLIRWEKYSQNKQPGKKITIFQKFQFYPEHIHQDYQGRIQLVQQASLEISHIRSSDDGLYECTISYVDSSFGDEKTHVHLKVNAKPSIIASSPQQLQKLLGVTVELFCRAKATPEPEVVWSKDGKPLINSNRVTIALDKETVEIRDLQRSDGGIYTCSFSNAFGSVSQRIDLIVQGAAYILNAPSNLTTLEGRKIEFQCGAAAYPDTITYRWFFKNKNVQSYGDNRITTYPDGRLVITPVNKNDMGWYTCRPSNGVGIDPEASAFLNVTYEPKLLIEQFQGHVTWALGYQERLDCPVDANPPIREVSWTKNSYVVAFSSDHITLLANGSLLVKSVQQTDAGKYSCTPISSIGYGQTSPLVQVEVQDPPRFVLRPDGIYQRLLGEDVTMVCGASGKPTPTINWRKVTGILNSGGRIRMNGGNLTIVSLEKTDHGQYECVAKNDVKQIVAVTKLIVQKTSPHTPFNVSVVTDWFSARISWIASYDGGSKQFFLIWYRSKNGQFSLWSTMQVPPETSTVFTVYNLTPDTVYEFKVLARNEYGNGSFSEVVTAKTRGAEATMPTVLPTDPSGHTYIPYIDKPVGPRPPAPFNVSARTENGGIRIMWVPPHLNSPPPIQYYVIEWKKPGETWKALGDVIMVPYTYYIWNGASPSTSYQFRVFAYSATSYSYPSNTVSITTPDEGSGRFGLADAEIGGIIGGLLFLLIAVTLAVIGVVCSKKKQKPDKFGNVKYIGPTDDVDTPAHYRPEDISEWSSGDASGRTNNSLRRIPVANGIYIVPQTEEIHRDMIPQEYISESKLYDPQHYIYNSDKGHLLPYAGGHDPDDWEGLEERHSRSRNRSQSKSRDKYNLSPQRFSSRHSSFPSDFQNQTVLSPSFIDDHTYVNIPSNHSSMQRVPDSSFHSRPYSSGYHGSSWDDDDENGFVPKRPPLPKEYDYMPRNSEQSVSLRSPVYENVVNDSIDDVFVPNNQDFTTRHSLPRHSSMKPSYQTYLTGDPVDDDGGFIQPFGANDISSVLPSFTESFSPSKDRFVFPPYDVTMSRTRLEQPNWNSSFEGNTFLPTSPHYERQPRSRFRGSDDRPRSRSSDYHSLRLDSSRTYLSDFPDENTIYERQIAQVSPSKRSPRSDSMPGQYTRDQLQGAVEKIRKGPKTRRSKSAGRLPSQETHSPDSFAPQVVPNRSFPPNIRKNMDRYDPYTRYSSDIAPYKSEKDSRSSVNSSGRGSMGGRYLPPSENRPFTSEDLTPDSVSSGIGSRNTSQVTGSSSHFRIPHNSVSSYNTPQDNNISQDSSPFLDNTGSLQKDTSADDNYEFDSLQALEQDLINTLRSYPSASQDDELRSAIESGLNTSDFYDDLYPKPSMESRYDNSEARFEKLRQEFQQFRRKQQEAFHQTRLAMDSDML